MKGIAEWLSLIGLSEYAQRFADNAIDLSVIRDLTEQDLKDLGVLLGHRRKIMRAISELDGVAAAPTETVTEPVLREAERRHLTVMICDLVGSTALSARLDPEDMRVVVDAYHAACARITRTYDGFLAEFRGEHLDIAEVRTEEGKLYLFVEKEWEGLPSCMNAIPSRPDQRGKEIVRAQKAQRNSRVLSPRPRGATHGRRRQQSV
jgi:hypothetical protein